MGIVVLEPVGEVEIVEVGLAPHLDSLDNKVIGILDDGFGCTVPHTFARLEELIKEKYPGTTVKHWVKPQLSQPSPVSLLDEIKESCDGIIVGVCG